MLFLFLQNDQMQKVSLKVLNLISKKGPLMAG